jgi:hypothetical protein
MPATPADSPASPVAPSPESTPDLTSQ